jgi:predicted PurR-regulated permease PerM
MNKQVILWLLLTGVAAAMAWYLQKFMADIIKPRESALRFIIFLLLTFVCIFLVIVMYGYLVNKGGLIYFT